MDWNEYIDIYCERVEPGLWAEPLNALSNIAFFLGAFFAYHLASRQQVLGPQSIWLIALLTTIGIGSTLFHTLATQWAQLADVIPILLFQVSFLIIYSRNVIKLDWTRTLVLIVTFAMLIRYFESLPREWLNGSLGYAPAMIFLGGFGVYHFLAKKREPFVLLAAAATFVVSLTFRSYDMAVCEHLSIGVHYFWHILNGTLLYLTLRGLFLNVKRAF